MSAPLIYSGRRAKLLTQDGLLRPDGSIIDNNGIVNLIKNGHAEVNTTGWTVSKNTSAASRPDSGFVTSSTNITWTRNTTNPIDGQADFLYTKDAANRQGEQVYYGFTVSKKHRAKVVQIEVDYLVNSGTFSAGSSSTDSDIIVCIYDVTNSIFIEPSSFKFLSNSSTIADKFIANFQTSATGSSYRILFHQATTSASAFAVQFKEIKISPCQYVYGTPISDWVSYTPTGTFTTNSTYTGLWRRVGDTLESQVKIAFAGAPNSTNLLINLPSGLSIDSNKVVSTSSDNLVFGHGGMLDNGTQGYSVYVDYGSSTSVRVIPPNTSGTYAYSSTYVTQALPFTIGAGDSLAVTYRVPITGWSSSVQVSDGYDARQIGTRVYLDGGTTVTSGSAFVFTSKSHDKTNSYDTSNGRFTAPSQGLYEVSALITYASSAWTTGNTNNLQLYKNGSFHSFIDANDATSTASYVFAVRGTAQIELNAGDYLTIIPSFTGSRSSISNAGLNWASFKKLSSPQTMSATEKLVASYGDNSGQSITTSNQIIGFNTLTEDTHAIKSGTGTSTQFIIPYQGSFRIFAQLQTGATTSSGNQYFIPKIYIDGSAVAEGGNRFPTSHISPTGTVEWTGPLNAGQIVTIRLDTDVAASRSLSSSAASNRMSIVRIK